ncbi:DUF2235 domain-containing protein [Streptomyces canus]|uniref:DUF2235 domain-containing protein n=1 Tax=Streptomyces canus TaxID=58343 RepID=UPI00224D3E01|nr:DUF2235 domain-containing protein [Streptomyces canus]MCX5262265.1 DUF2235 domain-containing protein [Streptomyces canus]
MAKRLIVCCDGTWSFADPPSNSNVRRVDQLIRRRGVGAEQLVYYQSGAGIRRWERLLGGALGVGLASNVLDAYRFLVRNYEPGDQLYLFGFSRGAYTVRSLAGLVRSSGILPPAQGPRIKEAWALYRSRDETPSGLASTLFRRAYAHEAGIRFIGVWDTVGYLGIPFTGLLSRSSVVRTLINRRSGFHDVELSTDVKGAFHAVAIDEQRAGFQPTLWHQQPGAADSGQELKQVWFTGAHTDIGGGYPDTGLSDITLLWMVAQATRYGLEFNVEKLSASGRGFRIVPNAMGRVHDSRLGVYRLTQPLHRNLGRAQDHVGGLVGCEYLSETAKQRYEEDSAYRPPGLEQYLREGEVRLDSVSMSVPGTGPSTVA